MHHRFHSFIARHHDVRRFGRSHKHSIEGGGKGARGFNVNRKLSSADRQLLLLGLLNEKPMHGYEIIKALDERSKGFYVPSPEMIYPALTYLDDIGYITAADGARKLYTISELGISHLETNRAQAEALFTDFVRLGENLHRTTPPRPVI
jgi:DNA-binding PadR family transcriptional regulator